MVRYYLHSVSTQPAASQPKWNIMRNKVRTTTRPINHQKYLQLQQLQFFKQSKQAGKEYKINSIKSISHVKTRMGKTGARIKIVSFNSPIHFPNAKNVIQPHASYVGCHLQPAENGNQFGTWNNKQRLLTTKTLLLLRMSTIRIASQLTYVSILEILNLLRNRTIRTPYHFQEKGLLLTKSSSEFLENLPSHPVKWHANLGVHISPSLTGVRTTIGWTVSTVVEFPNTQR